MIEEIKMNVSFIPLTQGQVAIVDTEDYNYLMNWKWCANYNKHIKGYYAVANQRKDVSSPINTSIFGMHRLLMLSKKGMVVDHINNNTLDNRRENLRIVSNRQNLQNIRKKHSSQFPGASWDKNRKKWQAFFSYNTKYYGTPEKAYKALQNLCNSPPKRRKDGRQFPGIIQSGKKFCGRKRVFLGYFDNEREAAKACEAFCRKNGEELVCKVNKGDNNEEPRKTEKNL